MDVADDVEGSAQVAAVVPRALAHDLDRVDLLGAAQHVHAPEALLGELAERPPQVAVLAGDDVRAEVAVGPRGVALVRQRLGYVETMASTRTLCSRASLTSDARAGRWTLVASTTVSRPRRSRVPTM